MKKYLLKFSVFLFLFSSVTIFAQKGYYDIEESMPFQPMFSIGSGYYSFQGDIQGPKANLIGGSNIGFSAGIRLNMSENFDMSLIFSRFSLSEEDASNNFSSELSAVGLQCDYTLAGLMKKSRLSPFLSFGVENFNFKTNDYDDKTEDTRQSSFAIPVGLGIMLDVSERIKINIGMNYAITMADIDKMSGGNNDPMIITDFTIHYDLFTPKPKEYVYVDESYYNDVNFKAFDVEDEDGDLIPDVNDHCPKTPQGVEVDGNGCPLDTDHDGIPNYIDEQEYTPIGAVVNERGVQLTDEQFRSMYSEYASASREYASHYNEYKIAEDDYKTINDYLIAKANAFNKAFNEGKELNKEVEGIKYKVKIASYNGSVPADEMNNLLCLDDLESITEDNGVVIYLVGSYLTLDGALIRQDILEAEGFDNSYILVDNNGNISDYTPPIKDHMIDESEEVEIPENVEVIIEEPVAAVSSTIYRIQIGAFNKKLSDEVFSGVDNVISFIGKDGLVRYMAGSFVEYKDAIDYKAQMKARGFEDAFIVTYKNGERISLNVAIKTENNPVSEEVIEDVVNLEFTVQIMVAKASVSAAELKKMSKLGKIDKEAEGTEMYRYFSGTYEVLEDANIQLEKAKLAGYTDAFIVTYKDGERITLQEAKKLMR